MMKVELKNCFLEEEHDHANPYLETYIWPDGSTSLLPACCLNLDIGISEFPSSIKRLIRMDTTTDAFIEGFASEIVKLAETLNSLNWSDTKLEYPENTKLYAPEIGLNLNDKFQC